MCGDVLEGSTTTSPTARRGTGLLTARRDTRIGLQPTVASRDPVLAMLGDDLGIRLAFSTKTFDESRLVAVLVSLTQLGPPLYLVVVGTFASLARILSRDAQARDAPVGAA